MRPVWRSMTSRNFFRCSASTGSSISASTYPRTAVSGVRSSCDTFATKSRRTRSTRRKIADVVEHEDGAPAFHARGRGLRPEDTRAARRAASTVERHLDRRPLFALQRRAELSDDARLPHGFDVVAPEQVARRGSACAAPRR